MNTKTFIPLSVPNLRGNELAYVTRAVETEWVSTAGAYVNDFETCVAEYVKTPSAVSCQNGTAGLHISLLLCGVTREDAVLVPALTFIAAVNPVRYIGAEPVFMDCDASLCMDPFKLRRFCQEECELRNGELYSKENGKRIPAVVVVHVFGNMADMEEILAIAKEYHLKVIEDATEALGTKYTTGQFAGKYAGTLGTVGVFSFNGNKIITTGGGGMIVSQDKALLEHARHLTTQAKSDEVRFFHDEIGYNYRLTNLQAAIGIAQMEQLEKFIEIKKGNYEHYREGLEKVAGLSILAFRSGVRANYWFYSLYVEEPYKRGAEELMEHLKEQEIQTRPVWGLIPEQIPYKGSAVYQIEKASEYWRHILNLPCSTNLMPADVERVIAAIRE